MSEIFEKSLKDSSLKIEEVLSNSLKKRSSTNKNLSDAIRYSVLGGGKRIRPFLVTECSKFFDVDENDIFQIAAAVELLHVYSLVHDDLPSIDNDDLRRGKPSTHIKILKCKGVARLHQPVRNLDNAESIRQVLDRILLLRSCTAETNGQIRWICMR